MKVSERDDLLIRLDERSRNIWVVVEKLEKHQNEANGFIQDNNDRSLKNTTWIVAFRWILGGIGTALIIGLTYLWGLW